MMEKLTKRLWDKKKSKKGFTLVELIVVLVILAILAAIMVPALLGWIDKAKEKQYVLEARGIYMAAQTKASELYAASPSDQVTKTYLNAQASDIMKMADVTDLVVKSVSTLGDDSHSAFAINYLHITFTSADGGGVDATLTGGKTWKVVYTPATD